MKQEELRRRFIAVEEPEEAPPSSEETVAAGRDLLAYSRPERSNPAPENWTGWERWRAEVFPYSTEPGEVEGIVKGIARSYGCHWSHVVNKLEELRPKIVVSVDSAKEGSGDVTAFGAFHKDADGHIHVHAMGSMSLLDTPGIEEKVDAFFLSKAIDRKGVRRFRDEIMGEFPPEMPPPYIEPERPGARPASSRTLSEMGIHDLPDPGGPIWPGSKVVSSTPCSRWRKRTTMSMDGVLCSKCGHPVDHHRWPPDPSAG